jgi:cytochrome c551/c552
MMQSPAPECDDVAANLARLEAALERIAQGMTQGMTQEAKQGSAPAHALSAMVADRLDAMIARLRAEIDE